MRGKQSTRASFHRMIIIATSLIYIGIGLAVLGNLHDAILIGICHISLGITHYLGHRVPKS